MHRLVGVGRERASRGGDVGRLRVVDVAHAAPLADELEAVRHARERRAAPAAMSASAIPAARAAAVAAAAFSRLCAPRISGSAGSSSSAENSIAVEPEAARHDLRARALEDAQLRVAVRLERAVPVEVVRLEVEQHGDVARELVHVLELERRQLADHPVGADLIDVSGVPTFPATATSRPAARKIAPRSSVVVVLPFVPVTPTMRAPGSRR